MVAFRRYGERCDIIKLNRIQLLIHKLLLLLFSNIIILMLLILTERSQSELILFFLVWFGNFLIF